MGDDFQAHDDGGTGGGSSDAGFCQGLIDACRQIKSPAELALMQTANDITLAALRHVHAEVRSGMTSADIAGLKGKATVAMGGAVEFSLVLLNEASAYPHGSHQTHQVREGSVILMDCGCNVHGYQSDMSRSWVHGIASAKQRKVWETVRRGQDVALATAKIGIPSAPSMTPSAPSMKARAGARATPCRDCRTAPATASGWTGTSRPIWCARRRDAAGRRHMLL
ncbi:MAG: M24 family metallopeptidase [Asticcacaulis sp.]